MSRPCIDAGAGDGNRTHASSLGSSRSAVELHPLRLKIAQDKILNLNIFFHQAIPLIDFSPPYNFKRKKLASWPIRPLYVAATAGIA